MVLAEAIHAFRWNAAGRISAQLGNWLITIFVMRLLSPSDYGLIGLVAILMALFGLVNDLGAIPALIQRPQIDTVLIRKVFALVLLTNTVLYAVAFFGAPFYAAFFGEPRLVAITRVFATMMILEALAAVPGVLLRRELKFKAISLIDFGATMIGSILVLALALNGWGVWSLVFGSLVKTVCNTAGLLAVTRFRHTPLFQFSGLAEVFSFGIKVSGSGIVWYCNRNLDAVLIGKFLGDQAVGLYSVANNLALMPVTKVMQLSQQIAFSTYSRIQSDRATVLRYLMESTRLASFVFFPICWGMSAVSPELVNVILGAKWHDAIPVLQIVAIGVPYRATVLLTDPVVNGMGRPDISLKNTLTTAGITPAALIIGIHWGLIGLCVASLAALLVAGTINLQRTVAAVNTTYSHLLSVSFPSIAAASVMYVAVVAARASVLADLPAAQRLIWLVTIGVVAYGTMTAAFNRPAANRSLQVIRGSL